MAGWRPNPGDVAGLAAAALLLAAAAQPPAERAPSAVRRVDSTERLRQAASQQQVALQAVAAAAERQRQAAAEAQRLAAERVAAAASLRTLEQATADAAGEAAALARRREDAEARLKATAQRLGPLLPVMERLSLYPAETLLAVPGQPENSVTGLIVLKGMAQQLEAQAEALRAEQAEVARLLAAAAAQDTRLAAAQSAQAAQEAALDAQIAAAQARGHDAEDDAAAATRRAAEQAAQAQNLRAALAQLEVARREDLARAQAEAAAADRARQDAAAAQARRREAALVAPAGPGLSGRIGSPVAGNIVHVFGEAGDGGPASGISYAAAPAARVTAPCGGRVVFAGPFRSYGQLVIIDCGGGYHFVLAGLDRLDVPAGRTVQAGEPVGSMGGWDPHGGQARPELYLELRDHGQPVNPAPFLQARS